MGGSIGGFGFLRSRGPSNSSRGINFHFMHTSHHHGELQGLTLLDTLSNGLSRTARVNRGHILNLVGLLFE